VFRAVYCRRWSPCVCPITRQPVGLSARYGGAGFLGRFNIYLGVGGGGDGGLPVRAERFATPPLIFFISFAVIFFPLFLAPILISSYVRPVLSPQRFTMPDNLGKNRR
jgi:hypothetical protein